MKVNRHAFGVVALQAEYDGVKYALPIIVDGRDYCEVVVIAGSVPNLAVRCVCNMSSDAKGVLIAVERENARIAAASGIEKRGIVARCGIAGEAMIAKRNGNAAFLRAGVDNGELIFIKMREIVGGSGVNERRPGGFLKVCAHAVAIGICGRRASFRFSGASDHRSVMQSFRMSGPKHA